MSMQKLKKMNADNLARGANALRAKGGRKVANRIRRHRQNAAKILDLTTEGAETRLGKRKANAEKRSAEAARVAEVFAISSLSDGGATPAEVERTSAEAKDLAARCEPAALREAQSKAEAKLASLADDFALTATLADYADGSLRVV